MTQIIYFSLALLFALFVVWYCFQDAAHWRNQSRLEKMRIEYFSLPLWIRLAVHAENDSAFETALIVVSKHWTFQEFQYWSYQERCTARAKLATVNLIKSRISNQ